MSPEAGVAIMMSNYFHDVATAMLAASGAALLLMISRLQKTGLGRDSALYFLSIHKGMTKVARFSLYWLLIGGIPRTLAFRSFEWSNAVSHGQIPALIAKHLIAFSVVALGVYLWLRASEKVKAIRLEAGV